MVRGLGLDLCRIERIAQAVERPRFLERVYTPRERSRILKNHYGELLAAARQLTKNQ